MKFLELIIRTMINLFRNLFDAVLTTLIGITVVCIIITIAVIIATMFIKGTDVILAGVVIGLFLFLGNLVGTYVRDYIL